MKENKKTSRQGGQIGRGKTGRETGREGKGKEEKETKGREETKDCWKGGREE